jgi:molybdopterin-guanine dinucleotide biosynthesis protein A
LNQRFLCASCCGFVFEGNVSYMNNHSIKSGAIILSGGKSQRMGKAKSELIIGKKTMLQHVVDIFHLAVDHIVVVCAPDQPLPLTDSDVIWANDVVGGQGPLRGVQAGLLALPPHVERVFLSSCDAPLLKPELVAHLFSYPNQTKAVVPLIGGIPQPLTAVYAADILTTVTQLLATGERSLQALLRNIDAHFVSEEVIKQVDPSLASFENANTPDDYLRILKIFGDMT